MARRPAIAVLPSSGTGGDALDDALLRRELKAES
jgi:hypothetical protein